MPLSFAFGARALRSLRHRHYAIWASGAVVSNIGTWMQRTAQDWLVLTQLTAHDATAVGMTMAFQMAPQLLFLPWTGYAADRFDRRALLMLTQGLMGALSLGLGILTVSGAARLWEMYVFAFLFGSVAAFDGPARQTFVSELVGREDLPNAVALNSVSFNAGRMLGPVAAGACIAAVGTGWAFVLNGISFIAVLMSLLALNGRAITPPAKRGARGLLEGFRYVWRQPDLRTIVLMLLLIGMFGLNFPLFISTMAVSVFHVGAGQYGLLSACMAVGTMMGAVVAAGREKVSMATLRTGALLFGVGCLLAAIAPGYGLFAASLGLVGLATLTFTTTTNSLMQLSAAPEMRGRVMAIRLAVALGGTPVGAPVVGWVANHFGPRWGLGLAAASGFAAVLVSLRTRGLKHIEKTAS
ncbi:MFS transporter [Komagataeibacter xylinus]|uniref:MFS transporter n=1 Tax=Komagataeibacter xylinus TaxID=28448 RepID=A0A857FTW4_KOMXY|nr:MFS transporter [Komagataeibacter xylinus]QHC36607.1 MFS transporter [Komagataeibacter xylinus]